MYPIAGKVRSGSFHGVMVSIQDSESCDPSSNLGGTSRFFQCLLFFFSPQKTLESRFGHICM